MTGPCLKPCPEPPPTIQTLSRSGWRSRMNSVSGVVSYWQTRVSTTGALARAGKRRARSPRLAGRVRIDEPLAVGRVEQRAVAVGGDLHAAAIDRRHAVVAAVVVDPAGQPLGREPAVAGTRPEEHDVLLGDRDELARAASGNSRGSQGPAANTNVSPGWRVPSAPTTSTSRSPSIRPGTHVRELEPATSAPNARTTAATPERAMTSPASGS